MPSIKASGIQKQFSGLGDTDAGIQLFGVEKALAELSAQFVIDSKNNLNSVDRVSSGSLLDSIVALPVKVLGKIVTAQVEVKNYYSFVDQGVQGWADEKGSNSKYHYGKISKVSSNGQFVASLKRWLLKEGAKITDNSKNKIGISSRERSRIKHRPDKIHKDELEKKAIAIAAIIKRKGLKRTGFWSNAETDLRKKIKTDLQMAFKIDVINGIK